MLLGAHDLFDRSRQPSDLVRAHRHEQRNVRRLRSPIREIYHFLFRATVSTKGFDSLYYMVHKTLPAYARKLWRSAFLVPKDDVLEWKFQRCNYGKARPRQRCNKLEQYVLGLPFDVRPQVQRRVQGRVLDGPECLEARYEERVNE